MTRQVRITRWTAPTAPTEAALRAIFAGEGMRPYVWSNEPGDRYAAHAHHYRKVIYVVEGSITFGLPDKDETLTLRAGDRLDLPPGVLHNAVVGPEGVVCLEGHGDDF